MEEERKQRAAAQAGKKKLEGDFNDMHGQVIRPYYCNQLIYRLIYPGV